jgi:hypothetical protein
MRRARKEGLRRFFFAAFFLWEALRWLAGALWAAEAAGQAATQPPANTTTIKINNNRFFTDFYC